MQALLPNECRLTCMDLDSATVTPLKRRSRSTTSAAIPTFRVDAATVGRSMPRLLATNASPYLREAPTVQNASPC